MATDNLEPRDPLPRQRWGRSRRKTWAPAGVADRNYDSNGLCQWQMGMERREWHGKRRGRGGKKKDGLVEERAIGSHWSWQGKDRTQKMRPTIWIYLQKCHHHSVFITLKHLKCVFSFHYSSLKNQRIKWWKQKLKMNPNKLFSHGTHQFWIMGDGNRVMGDGKQQIKTAPYVLLPCFHTQHANSLLLLIHVQVQCDLAITRNTCVNVH